jgi:hypothetical protein
MKGQDSIGHLENEIHFQRGRRSHKSEPRPTGAVDAERTAELGAPSYGWAKAGKAQGQGKEWKRIVPLMETGETVVGDFKLIVNDEVRHSR